MVTMMPDKSGSRVGDVRDLVAVGAALVGLIYVAGILVLGLRLWYEGLPPLAAVGSIPRETAVSIGTAQVVAPAFALGVLFLILITTRIKGPRNHYVRFHNAHGRNRRLIVATWLLGGAVTASPFVVRLFEDGYAPDRLLFATLAALAVGSALAMGYVHMRARIRRPGNHEPTTDCERAAENQRWRTTRTMLLRAALFAAATVPVLIGVAGAFRLPEGRVCFKATDGATPPAWNGLFVAQTDDRVYIGNSGDTRGDLQAFPTDVVGQVIVGKTAQKGTCRFPGHASSSGPSSQDRSSVTGHNIRDGTVTGRDIRDGTVTSRDIRNGTLRWVDFGPGIVRGAHGCMSRPHREQRQRRHRCHG